MTEQLGMYVATTCRAYRFIPIRTVLGDNPRVRKANCKM